MISRMSVITLTTDFGLKDWFVGTMKGVILRINPRATIVDITHEIGCGEIAAGAFALAASYRHFPKATIHVAVVDPGVGSERPALAVRTRDYFFVGPDNGVLSLALAGQRILSVRRLTNERFFLRPVSRTFHGRDVFSPVAAHLSKGLALEKLGPRQRGFVRLSWPAPRLCQAVLHGTIVYLDRFGNAFTNLATADIARLGTGGLEVVLKRRRVGPLRSCYAAVPVGQPVALIGSAGLLEVAVNGGSAAETLRLKIGDAIKVRSI